MNQILTILIGSIFVNNFAMSRFYGICPFLGVSKKLETAFGMGMAVTFVMAVASLVAYLVPGSVSGAGRLPAADHDELCGSGRGSAERH